ELAAALRDGGTTGGARPALLVCAAEEAPRFGAGTVGSRLLAGTLEEAARDDFLSRLEDLPTLAAPPLARLRAHAEVHVAQRRSLSAIGVVERVAVPRRLAIDVRGEA